MTDHASSAPSTVTLTRTLRGAQAERRTRLLDAARALAREGGYAAVTMHDVADRAGLSRATVYRYFASKDHLLTEVAADWAREIVATFSDDPPGGRTPATRVSALLDRILDANAAELRLASATVQAANSPDPAARPALDTLGFILGDHLDAAIGSSVPKARRADVETVILHVLLSALVALTVRGTPVDEVRRWLHTTARVVLPAR